MNGLIFRKLIMQNFKHLKGYTLIELLLVVGLLAVAVGILSTMDRTFIVRSDLDNSTEATIEAVRRARLLSVGGEGDSTWGVYISDGVTVFKGTSYAARDPEYDEEFAFSTMIGTSGLSEVVFSKQSGVPSATGDISIGSDIGVSNSITINEKGIPIY